MSTSRQAPVVWFPTIRAGSGADVFTRRLAQGLHQRGIPTRITWLPHRAEYAPWLIPPPSPPAGTNIVHVNTWLPERFMPRGLPIVATMHHCVHDPQFSPYKSGLQAFYHRVWIKPMERVVLRRANRVAAVSHYTAQRTLAAFDIPDITVIHNGIDLDGAFRPAGRSAPHTPFRLLYVGNWSKRKGAELLRPIMRSLGAGFELRYTGEPLQQGKVYMHCVGSGLTAPAAWLAARLSGGCCVAYLHRLDIETKHLGYCLLWHPFLRRCDRVIDNSRFTRSVAERIGIRLEHMQILHPGVCLPDLDNTKKTARRVQNQISLGDMPLTLYVGRITLRKGLLPFVRDILPQVVGAVADAKLVVIGSEPTAALLSNKGIRGRIEDTIRATGLQD